MSIGVLAMQQLTVVPPDHGRAAITLAPPITVAQDLVLPHSDRDFSRHPGKSLRLCVVVEVG